MLKKEFVFSITTEIVGIRLDKALSTSSEIISRSQATSLIDRGFVTHKGVVVKPSHKTSLSEEFLVQLPNDEPSELIPYDLALDIPYEDDQVLVVNKPANLVVHPAAGHRQGTLVNALVHHTNQLSVGFAAGRPGLVHRIDKDTTGLLVVAKTEPALRSLANQFKRKTVHRIYWAVVYGKLKENSGTITSYIRRHPVDRKKFASQKLEDDSVPEGKLAITHYEVKKVYPAGLTLIHCQLETGRTHQIRVHLSELGHPIVADPIYCSSHRSKSINSVRLRASLEKVPHLMLHAAELGFVHPTTRKNVKFKAPWPEELLPILTEVDFV